MQRYCTPLTAPIQELLTFVGKRNPDDTREDWLEDLRQCDDDLSTSLTSENSDDLDSALVTLRSILDNQPTRYDARLGAAIDAMDAPRLVTTLRGVANDIASFKARPDAQTPQRLDTFLGRMALIYQDVTDIVRLRNEHQLWQAFEDLLRLEYEQFNADTNRLGLQWRKRLSPRLQAVIASGPAERARRVQSCAASFEASLTSGNSIKVRELLWNLRSATSMRFNQVDHDLKDVCADLDKNSRPLSIAIEELN